ncbi:nuclear transport factor 2 family protein [Chondromyces crocatus]|uniref:Dioxygenase n=1 Tax=Chondromyces crocatus TaxID=52 RepID=A0A0K1E972_CHOCO|nr:nuclear transport factor 2 family protein [Chondromyces crocatus]AKT37113.1 dioxygenase [Chondromyces crocatus]
MSNSAVEIANLLYRYAELVDGGDLPGAAALFKNARMKIVGADALQDDAALLAMLQAVVKIHPCGTPRTRHLVTNPILEIDEGSNRATCRSCYTVLQVTEGIPLQVIAAGRYHDRFERVDGHWRFAYRDYTLFDLKGDVSGHLNLERLL